MFEKWITAGWNQVPMVVLSGIVAYAAILLYTRLAGLRSLSKMSAADFVMTLAVGSVFGATVSSNKPVLLIGLTALATLYAGQWTMATLRRLSPSFSKLVDNQPILLMAGANILDANLELANVTRSDLYAKLREANALNYDQVLAVVFETTGDISVLHSNDPDATLESDFFDSVIDADLLFAAGK